MQVSLHRCRRTAAVAQHDLDCFCQKQTAIYLKKYIDIF